jgi:hypothetical protein
MRWVGAIAGHVTTPDMLTDTVLRADHQRAITRIYAAAAPICPRTLAGTDRGSASWERWFAGIRSAARELSPARGNQHVVQRALFHGAPGGCRRVVDSPATPWFLGVARGQRARTGRGAGRRGPGPPFAALMMPGSSASRLTNPMNLGRSRQEQLLMTRARCAGQRRACGQPAQSTQSARSRGHRPAGCSSFRRKRC